MPTRTWFPFTPRMVTVTSLPIITVSPTRLVNISILFPPWFFGDPIWRAVRPCRNLRAHIQETNQGNPESAPCALHDTIEGRPSTLTPVIRQGFPTDHIAGRRGESTLDGD